MLPYRWIIFAILAIYSAVLVGIEWCTSQDYVRNFVCDIDGPVPFFAINTTLSVFLLWGTALLFAVCLACDHGMKNRRRAHWFYLSQIMVFVWLGLDDRFKLHEHIAWRLGIGDHFVLIVVAVAELLLLGLLGWSIVIRRSVFLRLCAASLLFLVMLFFDAVVPHDALLRLSLEDIAKTWASLFFCLFAWHVFLERVRELKMPQYRLSAGAA